MPKPRRKKGTKLKIPDGLRKPTADFVQVPTPELVVITDLEGLTNLDVAGRFVKVQPRIPASQRDSFDGARIADALREAGALAVVTAPIFLAETQRSEAIADEALNDRDAVRAWFAIQKAADPETLQDAETLVLDFMDAEGM